MGHVTSPAARAELVARRLAQIPSWKNGAQRNRQGYSLLRAFDHRHIHARHICALHHLFPASRRQHSCHASCQSAQDTVLYAAARMACPARYNMPQLHMKKALHKIGARMARHMFLAMLMLIMMHHNQRAFQMQSRVIHDMRVYVSSQSRHVYAMQYGACARWPHRGQSWHAVSETDSEGSAMVVMWPLERGRGSWGATNHFVQIILFHCVSIRHGRRHFRIIFIYQLPVTYRFVNYLQTRHVSCIFARMRSGILKTRTGVHTCMRTRRLVSRFVPLQVR